METISTLEYCPYYKQPHVWATINDYSQYTELVQVAESEKELPYSTMVVTGADEGIDNTFVRVKSLDLKQAVFGVGNFAKYGQSSIQADVLFNGFTNVWFCRVLPDNATYANLIYLVHYKAIKELDDANQETGIVNMAVKYSTQYLTSETDTTGNGGAFDVADIKYHAETFDTNGMSDPTDGYLVKPLMLIRSIGRGNYGNKYSLNISRSLSQELNYEMKMYSFELWKHDTTSSCINEFVGSLHQSIQYKQSTLITDVLETFSTGSCPISIHMYEDTITELFDFYTEIVAMNKEYVDLAGTADQVALQTYAEAVEQDSFDPLFGYRLCTKSNEMLPYYVNYTVATSGEYEAPTLTIPDIDDATKPLYTTDDYADGLEVGSQVLVLSDPLNSNLRWRYTIIAITLVDDGAIDPVYQLVYDEGYEEAQDAELYNGITIDDSFGLMLEGGHDGDFEEITVDGIKRAPTDAEMKLLLSREYVKAIRGNKDRNILSPTRIDIDFIFDANYNMTDDDTALVLTVGSAALVSNSNILTTAEAQSLSISIDAAATLDLNDLNVKAALYDLNSFRNKDGMTVSSDIGAGCHLYLDCGLTGNTDKDYSYEVADILEMTESFVNRNTSLDLGCYTMYDPNTRKKIDVTVMYHIAKNLVNHIMATSLNKPFVYSYSQLSAPTGSTFVAGTMIRDTFRPSLDIIDYDVNEELYESRINWWISTHEGRTVRRACQNTRQYEASALLEEGHVRVLHRLKKELMEECRNTLYEWNESTVRESLNKAMAEKYAGWEGNLVKSLSIKFTADEKEQEQMMMRCTADVEFRNIIKKIPLVMNVYKASADSES